MSGMGDTVFVSVYITKDFLPYVQLLKEVAKREGKTVSDIIREAIKEFIKEYEQGSLSLSEL